MWVSVHEKKKRKETKTKGESGQRLLRRRHARFTEASRHRLAPDETGLQQETTPGHVRVVERRTEKTRPRASCFFSRTTPQEA